MPATSTSARVVVHNTYELHEGGRPMAFSAVSNTINGFWVAAHGIHDDPGGGELIAVAPNYREAAIRAQAARDGIRAWLKWQGVGQ